PVLKEVKVQLLGNASTERKEGVGHDPRAAPGEVESATTIAAATAAAIASTAPLLKVQNDLEAKVNSVSALLNKLQETERHLLRVAEQQTQMRAQQEKPHCHQRISELEKQMNAFMHVSVTLCPFVSQSHLLSSAVNTRGFQQSPVPSCSLLPKPPEQPEQRSLTNQVPLCHGGLVPASDAPAQGEGKLLVPCERKLLEQEMPPKQNEYSKKTALNSNNSWHSERDRHNVLPADPVPAFEGYSSVEKTVKKADDLLQDLGQLRREMHNMLQEADSWKSDMNDLIKSKNPTVATDPPEHPLLNRPSILQNIQVPKSILRNAERTLRGVQNNKKVLEENLEAVTHAKDGDATYSFINSLTTNRDVLEEIRIRRTVDKWIKAISEEIQAEMARNDLEQVKHDQKFPWIKRAQTLKAMKARKEMKAKTQKIQGCLTKLPSCATKPLQKQEEDDTMKQRLRTYFPEGLQRREGRADVSCQGPGSGSALVANEDYLCRVYGKPIYQGHRSTLKKAPYLRFNSPSPKSKLPRPKLVECVKG
ncbi:TALD3 protein, partial [Tachuris rubrigastra]|nr:TALD3 protein [Tachuris rubrigastra]